MTRIVSMRTSNAGLNDTIAHRFFAIKVIETYHLVFAYSIILQQYSHFSIFCINIT